eukprot:c25601_g2_i1 orf=223-486(-)
MTGKVWLILCLTAVSSLSAYMFVSPLLDEYAERPRSTKEWHWNYLEHTISGSQSEQFVSGLEQFSYRKLLQDYTPSANVNKGHVPPH